MKRSEMIQKIRTMVDDVTDGALTDYGAELVLNKLEAEGMLPPTICYNAIHEFDNIKNTDILHDNDISFAWEPEDETK